jgi:hypothetical protein
LRTGKNQRRFAPTQTGRLASEPLAAFRRNHRPESSEYATQFKNQAVSYLCRPENGLGHCILFNDVPTGGYLRAEKLPKHRWIAGALEISAQVVVNEIENSSKVGESDFAGLGFATVGNALHKGMYKVNREFIQFQVAVVPAEECDYRLIGPYGVFLSGTGDSPSRSWRHRLLSRLTSFSLGLACVGQRD